MGEYVHIVHDLEPVYDASSRLLILGSLPSVRSRGCFFYNHPQNRFWRVLAQVMQDEVPLEIDEKKAFLLKHHVALWDVIESCDIIGSSDSTIRNAKANDIGRILETADIRHIYVNGRTAEKYYKKFLEKETGIPACLLPSTSPANAGWSAERLLDAWKVIRNDLE